MRNGQVCALAVVLALFVGVVSCGGSDSSDSGLDSSDSGFGNSRADLSAAPTVSHKDESSTVESEDNTSSDVRELPNLHKTLPPPEFMIGKSHNEGLKSTGRTKRKDREELPRGEERLGWINRGRRLFGELGKKMSEESDVVKPNTIPSEEATCRCQTADRVDFADVDWCMEKDSEDAGPKWVYDTDLCVAHRMALSEENPSGKRSFFRRKFGDLINSRKGLVAAETTLVRSYPRGSCSNEDVGCEYCREIVRRIVGKMQGATSEVEAILAGKASDDAIRQFVITPTGKIFASTFYNNLFVDIEGVDGRHGCGASFGSTAESTLGTEGLETEHMRAERRRQDNIDVERRLHQSYVDMIAEEAKSQVRRAIEEGASDDKVRAEAAAAVKNAIKGVRIGKESTDSDGPSRMFLLLESHDDTKQEEDDLWTRNHVVEATEQNEIMRISEFGNAVDHHFKQLPKPPSTVAPLEDDVGRELDLDNERGETLRKRVKELTEYYASGVCSFFAEQPFEFDDPKWAHKPMQIINRFRGHFVTLCDKSGSKFESWNKKDCQTVLENHIAGDRHEARDYASVSMVASIIKNFKHSIYLYKPNPDDKPGQTKEEQYALTTCLHAACCAGPEDGVFQMERPM